MKSIILKPASWVMVLVCVAFFAADSSALTVSGIVVDSDGQVARGVPVMLQRGATVFANGRTDANGAYSVTFESGDTLTAVVYLSGDYLPNVIQNLSGRKSHTIFKVLVRNTGRASLNISQATEAVAALEYLKQYPQLFSTEIARYDQSIDSSRFPREVQDTLNTQTTIARLDTRIGELENRLGQAEQNSQRLSGSLEESAAISNAARGGAKAAQETADAAVAGVNATNERISALDNYETGFAATIPFKPGSAELSPEAKAKLDDAANKMSNARGYLVEIAGFTDGAGSPEENTALSQRRADAVVRYLVGVRKIPQQRFLLPLGLGDAQPLVPNNTPDAKARNNRVELKVLINRGLTQPALLGPSQTP